MANCDWEIVLSRAENYDRFRVGTTHPNFFGFVGDRANYHTAALQIIMGKL